MSPQTVFTYPFYHAKLHILLTRQCVLRLRKCASCDINYQLYLAFSPAILGVHKILYIWQNYWVFSPLISISYACSELREQCEGDIKPAALSFSYVSHWLLYTLLPVPQIARCIVHPRTKWFRYAKISSLSTLIWFDKTNSQWSTVHCSSGYHSEVKVALGQLSNS